MIVEARAVIARFEEMIDYLSEHEPERVTRPGFQRLVLAMSDLEAATATEPPPSGHDEFMALLRTGQSANCPTCERHAAIYKVSIGKALAYGLARFAREFGTNVWVDVPEWKAKHGLWQSNNAALLRHWGLLEPKVMEVKRSNASEDSADHAGHGTWRLTDAGLAFTRGDLAVPKYAILYNSACLALVGDPMTIRDVKGFSFDELALNGSVS